MEHEACGKEATYPSETWKRGFTLGLQDEAAADMWAVATESGKDGHGLTQPPVPGKSCPAPAHFWRAMGALLILSYLP